jgi:predicted XRE-type DNA-binding protein
MTSEVTVVKSRFGKLEDVRIEAQLLVISLTKLKDTCGEMDIPDEVVEKLTTAIRNTELFRREVAALLLVERGVINDPNAADE